MELTHDFVVPAPLEQAWATFMDLERVAGCFPGATVTVQLAASGEGTRVDVTTDLSITGKPAQSGRGVMQDVSDKLLGQFVACIEQRLAAGGEAPGAAAPVRETAVQ